MSESSPARLPLQTGATWWRARVAIPQKVVPAVLAVVWLVWFMYAVLMSHEHGEGFGLSVPGWLGILVFLVGAGAAGMWLVEASAAREHARTAAPCDLVATPTGFRIEGGAFDGAAAEWKAIQSVAVTRKRDKFLRALRNVFRAETAREQAVEVVTLRVQATGRDALVFVATDRDEARALEAIAAVIATAIRDAHGGAPPGGVIGEGIGAAPADEPALGVAALACPSCGAAVAPEPDAEVACAKCKAAVPVPDAIRAKVTAAYALPALRATGQQALREMLGAPGAASTRAIGTALGWIMLALWPAAIAAGWLASRHRDVDRLGWLAIAAGTIAAIALVDQLVRPRFLRRHALPVSVIDYGARGPAYPGGPLRCRTCEAALPSRFDGRVARCAACASDSVLGLDLSRELPLLRAQARDLDAELAAWRRTRARAALLAVASAIGLAALGGVAAWRLHGVPRGAALEKRCGRADPAACVELATMWTADRHWDRARAALERGCDPAKADAATADACERLGHSLGDTLAADAERGFPPLDLARAEALLRGACAHGDSIACDEHGSLCQAGTAPPGCGTR